MLYVIADSRRSYPVIVERLEKAAGATVIELDGHRRVSTNLGPSKTLIVRRMLSRSLLSLRWRWTSEDRVLVIHWYVVPILVLIRLGYLPRPQRLVAMATFVQSTTARRIVNGFFRLMAIPELEFIAFSEGERVALTGVAGVPAGRVHKLMWAGKLEPKTAVAAEPPYVFTGGYANRDYGTFFDAVRGLPHHVVAVASQRNCLRDAPVNVDLRLDVPLEDFDRLVRGCRVVVLPLKSTGEASGQSVLTRGMRYGLPVVATRHDGLIDYLGTDYPGYVPAENADELRLAIDRAMSDDTYRAGLIERIKLRREVLHRSDNDSAQQVLAVLQRA